MYNQYLKEVGKLQTRRWRQRPHAKLWKKVSPFAPLPVPHPLTYFAASLLHIYICIRIDVNDTRTRSPRCLRRHERRLAAIATRVLNTPRTAGVHGTITRYVTTINGKTATYHFYELDTHSLDADWLEGRERRREWVDYAEAIRRLQWKPELAQGLSLSTLAPRR